MSSARNSSLPHPSPSRPSTYPPSQTLLLLLDFHALFVEQIGSPHGPAALEKAITLRLWAKTQGIEVVHCLIDPDAEIMENCKDPVKIEGIVAKLKEGDGRGGREPEGLRMVEGAEEGEVTLLRQPGLGSALKSRGWEALMEKKRSEGEGKGETKSLILCGLSTSGCVLRTALAAVDEGFVVTVVEDACAESGRVEGLHEMIVGHVLPSRAFVVRLEELVEGWERGM